MIQRNRENGARKNPPALRLVHQMLVLDAFLVGPLDQRQCRPITRRFVSDLLAELNMEPLAPLGIFPAVDARAPGWSFVQPITTSHVSAHYFEKPGRHPHMRLDAYSCDSICRRRLILICHAHFGLADWRATFIDREIDGASRRRILELSGTGQRFSSETDLTACSPANRQAWQAS